MANIDDSRKIVEELKAVFAANADVSFVSTGAVEPLASESHDVAVYISPEEIATEPVFNTTKSNGYNRHMLVTLFCNVDCTDDNLRVFDIADSLERSLLTDTAIWGSLIDRDIISIVFDNQQSVNKRTVSVLLDVMYRLNCL